MNNNKTWAPWIFNNPIDLKQFSITVDGQEVFNTLTTGIDTVKPDDYEVVGNPVITDDGVASGFNTTNVIQLPITGETLYNANTWEIKFRTFVSDTSGTAYSSECGLSLSSNNIFPFRGGIYIDGAGHVRFFDNDIWALASKTYSVGDWVNIKLTFDLSTGEYKLYTSNGNNSLVQENSIYVPSREDKRLSVLAANTNFKLFCANSAGVGVLSDNSIDFNSFKIYVDGELVYQPCLKIPYTGAKNGTKIVDVQYRDRVEDFAKQTGHNHYWTIDEENKNFTLGDYRYDDIVEVGQTENGYYKMQADMMITQYGYCTANEETQLMKPYGNNDYVVSMPTLNKDGSAFTPTESGSYVAIGKAYI